MCLWIFLLFSLAPNSPKNKIHIYLKLKKSSNLLWWKEQGTYLSNPQRGHHYLYRQKKPPLKFWASLHHPWHWLSLAESFHLSKLGVDAGSPTTASKVRVSAVSPQVKHPSIRMTPWCFLLNRNENISSKNNYKTMFKKELQNDVHSIIGNSKPETR